MTPESLFDIAGHVGGILAGLVAAAFTAIQARERWFTGSKTKVEASEAIDAAKESDRAELVKIKDEIIGALREQNITLEKQLQQSMDREKAWIVERRDLRHKVDKLQEEYGALLHGIVEGDWCGIARFCDKRTIPGERRLELATGGEPT